MPGAEFDSELIHADKWSRSDDVRMLGNVWPVIYIDECGQMRCAKGSKWMNVILCARGQPSWVWTSWFFEYESDAFSLIQLLLLSDLIMIAAGWLGKAAV